MAKKEAVEQNKRLTETQRWVLGVVLFAFAVFLLVAVVAYYFYWHRDQSTVLFGGREAVMNPAGPTGAKLAHWVVGQGFGVFGVIIPLMLIILSLRIIDFRPPALNKSLQVGLLGMILGSLSMGFVFKSQWAAFGTGLGGAMGIYAAQKITDYLGVAGTGLSLLVGWILLGVYITRRTISVVNNAGKGLYNKVGDVLRPRAEDYAEDYPGDCGEYADNEGDSYAAERAGGCADDSASDDGAPWDDEPDAPWAGGDGASATSVATGRDMPAAAGLVPALNSSYSGDYAPGSIGAMLAAQVDAQNAPAPQSMPAVPQNAPALQSASVVPQNMPARQFERAVAQNANNLSPEETPDLRRIEIVRPPEPEHAEIHVQAAVPPPSTVVEFGQAAGNFIVRDPAATHQMPLAAGQSRVIEVIQDDRGGQVQSAVYGAGDGAGHDASAGQQAGQASSAYGAGAGQSAYGAGSGYGAGASAGNGVRQGGQPNQPLAVGGVMEAAAQQGMRVVQAGHNDAQLDGDEIEDSLYDPTRELSRYQIPPVEILEDHTVEVRVTEEEIYDNRRQIETTLNNFGIKIDKIKATIGPTVTLYEIVPSAGVKIAKIKNLEDDIALSLKALGIRIIAPMPGRGTIGIEVPNKDKEIVSMHSVVRTRRFQESKAELPVVLGKTISNETFVIDLTQMPHLLVAGATGQGKSVGLNAIITSLLYRKHPAELKFVFVDPKRVELSLYGKLENHFLAKMESEEEAILTDTQKVVYTLNSLCELMSQRYDLLRAAGVKKISEYNEKFKNRRLNPNKGHAFMPYIVVVVDEFADLIMTAGREIETPLTRLAQLARAVGIHLVIATQRPDVKVITGLIKANFPARIAFRVMSMVDSRTIIDQPGANQLIGRGDMLISLNGELTRVQCAFIDTPEIERVTEFIGRQVGYSGPYELPDYVPEGDGGMRENFDDGSEDALFEEVARFVVQNQQGSTSAIQRRFEVGYNRAGRLMDQLERRGIVGRANGSKPREVLIMSVESLNF